jgi:hypothetical protein
LVRKEKAYPKRELAGMPTIDVLKGKPGLKSTTSYLK